MATHSIDIIGWATSPDTSGDVFFEPYSIKMGAGRWDEMQVCIFNDTAARDGLQGRFRVPENYVGTANLIIDWTPDTGTSGDVEWDFEYRAVAAGTSPQQSFAQTTQDEAVNAADTANAVDVRESLSISLTDGNFATGDIVQWELFRDGTDAGDTMSGAAILFGLYFEYADA